MTASTRRRWYNPYSVWKSIVLRPRLYLAVLAGLSVMLILPASAAGHIRETVGWIVGSAVFVAMVSHMMWACAPSAIEKQAAHEDESRMVIMVLVLLAIGSSFASIVGLLNEAKAAGQSKWLYLLLAGGTTIASWTVTQFVFTLHYAHEYYRPDTGEDLQGGLDFPGEKNPDYWDFLYFAISIGAASQTSDVAIRSRGLRRLVTVHSVVSFFFNTAILALTINLAASLV
jgi:uncharacterized membrane protein